ncbi:MAG: hypothetical protein K9K79_01570 [Desulfohalobiaceae bacterium]|nr:hypothetical protein [Desulfohalobiaceae bacterium]
MPSSESRQVRLNILIPKEMRDRLAEVSAMQDMKMSALVRESIIEKINQLEKEQLQEDMRLAYEGLAEENTRFSEEFRFVDAEHLD